MSRNQWMIEFASNEKSLTGPDASLELPAPKSLDSHWSELAGTPVDLSGGAGADAQAFSLNASSIQGDMSLGDLPTVATPDIGAPAAPGPAASLQTLANYLKTGYWSDVESRPGRYYNIDDNGIGANSGVLYYNISGYNSSLSTIYGSEPADSDGLSAARQAIIRDVFDVYEEVLGINFVETTSTSGAVDFFFRDNGSSAYAASQMVIGNGGPIDYTVVSLPSSWPDVRFRQTAFHEIGHALGLGHQGPYNTSGDYGTDALYANDSYQLSMMSYFSQTENTSINASFARLQTPMSVDWLALNDLYKNQDFAGHDFGVNNAFNGNTTYGFNTNITAAQSELYMDLANVANSRAFTIVDGSGIDTVDFSGYSANQHINLAVASASSTTGTISDVGGLTGNMTLGVGTVIENATGGSGNDSIGGNQYDNTLKGGGGNDTLNGLNGDDILSGDAGDDTLLGGNGDDSLLGGTDDDFLKGGGGADQLDGGSGIDTASYADSNKGVTVDLDAGTGSGGFAQGDTLSSIENVTGSAYVDVLAGSAVANELSGGNGDDILSGRAGNDTLRGNNDDDTLKGGGGADDLNGGSGIDTASYLDSAAGVTVSLLTGMGSGGEAEGDTLTAIENLTGSSHDDTLTGNSGANTLTGLAGNDILKGGGGADVLSGGGGVDTVVYSDSSSGVTINLDTETASGGSAQGDTFSGIENVSGSSHADTLIGNSTANGLAGEGGDDYLNGGDGADTLEGGSGNDTMKGGGGADTLNGGNDADTILGEAGIDTINGGAGDDVIVGGTATDIVEGGSGNDMFKINSGEYSDNISDSSGIDTLDVSDHDHVLNLDLGAGTYTLYGAANTISGVENVIGTDQGDSIIGDGSSNTLNGKGGDDSIAGAGGGDDLRGGSGQDDLHGGGGTDNLRGNSGRDTLNGGNGGDTLIGGGGRDMASYAGSNAGVNVSLASGTASGGHADGDTLISIESLIGSSNNDTLEGNGAANTLEGGTGADELTGRNGNDTLEGGGGGDILNGGNGRDVMSGDNGRDTFDFNDIGESVVGAGRDRINDFIGGGIDMLDLFGIDADSNTGADDAFDFIGSNAFSNTAGELHQVAQGNHTIVEGDVDGDSIADFQILLANTLGLVLTASDFVL